MLKKTINLIFAIILLQSQIISQNTIIDKLNADTDIQSAIVGVYAVNAKTGKVLVDYNSDKNLKPASNLKLLTTIAALKILGENNKFDTKLMYSGTISKNTLNGDLYIIGGGDPTLGADYFYDKKPKFIIQFIDALNKAQITQISGNLIIVDTLFKGLNTPSTWICGDIGNYYGSGPSSISIFNNVIKLYFNTKVEIDDTVKLIKTNPYVNIALENNVVAKKITNDRTTIYSSELSSKKIISGELPIGKDSFIVKGSITNPEEVLAEYFTKELSKNNIILKGKHIVTDKNNSKLKLTLLTTFYSPTIKEIVKQTNLTSNNLYAETLLRQINIKYRGNGTNISAVSSLFGFWVNKGLNSNNIKLFDGSGLSSYNLISTKQLVKALQFAYSDSIFFNTFKQTLPIGGVSGTLKDMFYKTNINGKVYAKSGTMNSVKAYSGYILKQNTNENIIFSIIFNNFTINSTLAKNKIQQIIVDLSNSY